MKLKCSKTTLWVCPNSSSRQIDSDAEVVTEQCMKQFLNKTFPIEDGIDSLEKVI